MKARLKKKLAKRRGYKRYDNKKIKYQIFCNYILSENERVISQLYFDQLVWGCSYSKMVDGKLSRIHPYLVNEEEGKVIFSNGSEVKILHR